jgi:tetratricopeptide (TPR) repeat protein
VLLQRALRLANRATDRERLLIAGDVALVGMSATATALADTVAARYPLDPDAQFVFGHALLRRGDFLAAAAQYRRVIAMDSLSLHLDARCLACDAYGNLTWSYLYADSADAAARVMHEFVHARPGVNSFTGLEMTLARAGRFTEARRALQAADSLAPGNIDLEFYSILLSLREGLFARADARLRQMMRGGNPQVREQAAWYLVLSLRTQGRLREALQVAERTPNKIARPIVLLEMGRGREAAEGFQALVGVTDTTLTGHSAKHRSWFFTHVATSLAAARDTTRLQGLADSVEVVGQFSAFGRDLRLHSYIRGLLWNARHEPQRAAEEFRKSIWSWSEGYTRANYELARALIALKKPAEAVYPLQATLRGDLEASNMYMSRTELHELLAQTFDQLGQRDSAAAHYREVVNAWRHADADLQPRFAATRARLFQISEDHHTKNGAF